VSFGWRERWATISGFEIQSYVIGTIGIEGIGKDTS
jgi:hypothetical protein